MYTFLGTLCIYLPCNSTTLLLGIYKGNKDICPYKDLHKTIHSHFVYKSKKFEKKSKYLPTGKWIHKLCHRMEYYLPVKKNKPLIYRTTWENFKMPETKKKKNTQCMKF